MLSRCLLGALIALIATTAAAADETAAERRTGGPVGTGVIEHFDSAALRATVFGTPPDDMADLPERVPLSQLDVELPWRQPVPDVYWFNQRLRVFLSAQPEPAPMAIVIAGTGSDGNAATVSTLRGALYGAGYHVLSLPSPTVSNFIVAASSTGVAGDLQQDSRDLHRAIAFVLDNLPRKVTMQGETVVVGYSLGGAHAAMVKAIDDERGDIGIGKAVMINPPYSLFASVQRLDDLFSRSIGDDAGGVERLYQQLYAQLANLYRASERVEVDGTFLLGAAAAVLKTDREFAAAVALTFRMALMNLFFTGDLYAGTGVVVDPARPPRVGDSMEQTAVVLRNKRFSEYFDRVFVPYYQSHRPGATRQSLIDGNRLDIIAPQLRDNDGYFVQTTRNDLILDANELRWLQSTLGSRIVVYDNGGHLGNVGSRAQIADMLTMLAGQWSGATP